ncbi:unnamed protein product [Leuciscus chuanchicus]
MMGLGPFGQHVSGGLYKSPRRYQIQNPSQADGTPPGLGSAQSALAQGSACARPSECGTRQTVQKQSSDRRMVFTPTDSRTAMEDIWSLKRTLIFRNFSPRAGTRWLTSGPALCVSPCHAPTPGVRADQGERMPSATRRPIFGQTKPGFQSDEYRPVADTGEEGSPLAGKQFDLASLPGALVPTCVGHQRVPVNLPAGVLNMITQARAPSTRRLYSSKWSVFTSWCTASGTLPSRCGVTEVLSFLQELLDKGRTPSTLKVYMAAIAAFAEPPLGQSLGRNDLVIRFLRGAKRLNPPRPPSVPVWDLSMVLEAMKGAPFEPIQSIDLKLLSFKTVFLLALASVKRIGDLQALSVSATCMEFGPNDSRVILKPKHGYVPKSLNTPFRAQVISLSALPVSEEEGDAGFLCPVRALRAYVSRSSVFSQTEQLFVLFSGRSKGLAASKQSLSRWIVDAIALAYTSRGLQCPIGVKAHSTRGMASSWAWSSGIALQNICMAAGWASPSTFISSVQQKRSNPESSCVSMKSNQSMDPPIKFKSGDKRPSSVQQKRSNPESSCVSMKSNRSMEKPLHFKSGVKRPDLRSNLLSRPVKNKTVYKPVIQPQDFNESMYPGFSHDSKPAEVLNTLRSNLRKKFECLYEGISKQGNPTLLNKIYTELYITESQSGEINNEHEVRQIEAQSRRAETEDTPIKCSDIFRHLPGQDKPIRTVLTKGVAGIGKTVSVQKFILDQVEEKENQDIQLIFPLAFRELGCLSDLLHLFFPETKETDISSDEYKVLFIFDGLDECRLSLDFQSDVEVLLTNLIVGNLLPSALIWITSRPAAADLVPSECVHRVTEVRGFSDTQKEEYFRKRISVQSLADRIISHLKSSRSLFIMCHIPVFCWISATVLEKMFRKPRKGKFPKTLTQMYTHFLIIQTNIKHEKDYKKVKDKDMIVKLGKLAYQQLVKGNLIFYEEDLSECGIDVTEASVYSGLCTQIFREELGLCQGKVFCFVHLSMQEHLAALYVHLSFINDNINVFDQITKPTNGDTVSLSDLHQRAVDEALDSKNGHLDLFLRFLLGLSVKSNQSLLQELKTQTSNSSHSNKKTVEYIKEKISENPSPDKYINLFHCLNELGDLSLVNKAQPHMSSGGLRDVNLSSSQWSALVFVLLSSERTLLEFNLNSLIGARNDYVTQNTGDEVLQKLLPVVTATRSAVLRDCGVTDEGCAALASALRSNPSHLRKLYLYGNNLRDSGVKLFSAVLENPHCKLEILCLSDCGVTDEGCGALASALRSNPSHVRKLYLYGNKLGDSGVKLLSTVLEKPQCKLEELRLRKCGVTVEGCAALSSALISNPSHMRNLNLSENKLGDSGVKLFSAGLANLHCKLETLWLSDCGVTDEGCAALASALRSNPSHLRQLDLARNKLGDSGVKLLKDLKNDPHYKLQILMELGLHVERGGSDADWGLVKAAAQTGREWRQWQEDALGDEQTEDL